MTAAGAAVAQQSAGASHGPAPVVRSYPRNSHPAPHPAPSSRYQDSFPVTYSPDGKPQRIVLKLKTTSQAAKPAQHLATPVQHPAAVVPGRTPPIRQPKPAAPSANTNAAAHPAIASAEHSTSTATASDPVAIPPQPFNRTTIVLDPAHGGNDNGSRISDSILEKNVTLALALKLRSLLQARGFTVVMTRDSDVTVDPNNPAAQLTLDTRAGIANNGHAVACLLLHATGSGVGVHLYHSELAPIDSEPVPTPWLTAQAAWVSQSSSLADKLSQAITRSGLPLVSSAASVRPMDSLTCPALILEVAPKESGDPSSLNDESYLQSVADPIASALVFWKTQAQPPSQQSPANASAPRLDTSGHTVTTP